SLSFRSLDHLVGTREQRFRHGEAYRLRGFEIDHQLIFRWRLVGPSSADAGMSRPSALAVLRLIASLSRSTLDGPGAFCPAIQLPQSLQESGVADLCLRIVRGVGHGGADAPHALALLRARRERPRRGRADKQRYELAAPHSITSSARSRNDSGIASPSAFAVVRLITRSNLVGCSTGISFG